MQLHGLSSLRWCVTSDFNDLLSIEEKRGQSERPPWMMRGFREAVNYCGLTDLVMEGYLFTWVHRRGSEREVEERLDRAMTSSSWMNLFPEAQLKNLLAPTSDHSPIMMQCEESHILVPNRWFRFENKWLMEPDIEEVVQRGWSRCPEGDIIERLVGTTDELSAWSRQR